jgi:hypothetical protein
MDTPLIRDGMDNVEAMDECILLGRYKLTGHVKSASRCFRFLVMMMYNR